MCLSWHDLLRNYPRPLCESPAVLKETIPLACVGLLFTDNCCKQAIALSENCRTGEGDPGGRLFVKRRCYAHHYDESLLPLEIVGDYFLAKEEQ
jgi:hypothetical protein